MEEIKKRFDRQRGLDPNRSLCLHLIMPCAKCEKKLAAGGKGGLACTDVWRPTGAGGDRNERKVGENKLLSAKSRVSGLVQHGDDYADQTIHHSTRPTLQQLPPAREERLISPRAVARRQQQQLSVNARHARVP